MSFIFLIEGKDISVDEKNKVSIAMESFVRKYTVNIKDHYLVESFAKNYIK